MITSSTKIDIRKALEERIRSGASQAELARALAVSSSYISQLLNADDLQKLPFAESTWKKLRTGLGIGDDVFATRQYKSGIGTLMEAKKESYCAIIDGDTGMGKTTMVRSMAKQQPSETYIARCYSDLTAREFLREIARKVGVASTGTKAEIRKAITRKLSAEKYAVLIIDEAENLKDSIYGTLKDLFDDLEGKAAIVLVGMDIIEKIDRLCSSRKAFNQPFKQLRRRFNRKLQLGGMHKSDVRSICSHYGFTDREADEMMRRFTNFGDLIGHLKQLELDNNYAA